MAAAVAPHRMLLTILTLRPHQWSVRSGFRDDGPPFAPEQGSLAGTCMGVQLLLVPLLFEASKHACTLATRCRIPLPSPGFLLAYHIHSNLRHHTLGLVSGTSVSQCEGKVADRRATVAPSETGIHSTSGIPDALG